MKETTNYRSNLYLSFEIAATKIPFQPRPNFDNDKTTCNLLSSTVQSICRHKQFPEKQENSWPQTIQTCSRVGTKQSSTKSTRRVQFFLEIWENVAAATVT